MTHTSQRLPSPEGFSPSGPNARVNIFAGTGVAMATRVHSYYGRCPPHNASKRDGGRKVKGLCCLGLSAVAREPEIALLCTVMRHKYTSK